MCLSVCVWRVDHGTCCVRSALFLVPAKDVLTFRKQNSVGQRPFLPFLSMLNNCIVWCVCATSHAPRARACETLCFDTGRKCAQDYLWHVDAHADNSGREWRRSDRQRVLLSRVCLALVARRATSTAATTRRRVQRRLALSLVGLLQSCRGDARDWPLRVAALDHGVCVAARADLRGVAHQERRNALVQLGMRVDALVHGVVRLWSAHCRQQRAIVVSTRTRSLKCFVCRAHRSSYQTHSVSY